MTITFVMKVVVVSLIFWADTWAMEGRVVGGDFASIKKFPHSVFLECHCADGETICGASVLNQKILLTAAHCLYDCKGTSWSVKAFAGNEHLEKMSAIREITEFIMHPKYNPTSFRNDISLALLSKHLRLGVNVKRVYVRNKLPNVKNLQVAGWGTVNEETDEQAIKLKYVKQTLLPKQYCDKVTSESGALCAKNSATQHPSRGDSGSALVTTAGEQIGLVSFRFPNIPELVVYTNVPSYNKWIRVHARRLYCHRK